MTIAFPPFAVSSWSLHRRIGLAYPDSPAKPGDAKAVPTWGQGQISILEFPQDVKKHDFDRVEICHFQLKNRDPGYLSEIRAALKSAGVALQTLLIDDADISQPAGSERDRDIAWAAQWIEAAAVLGAEAARVVAGKQVPSPVALQRSVDGLRLLAKRGKDLGVRVITENWFALTPSPKEVYYILDRLEDEVGFLADTGNWSGPEKYDDLAAIFARADRCHAKASFGEGLTLDREDYGRCIEAAKTAGYQGPMTLIFDAPGDEWAGLEIEREFVRAVWANGMERG